MPTCLRWSSERSIRIGCDDPAGVYLALRGAALRGVIDLTPGFGCVQVEVDPLAGDARAMERAIREAVDARAASEATHPREHTIPVCYEPPHAPDLGAVAERAGLSPERVIELHTGAAYRVEVIGFSPGFGYLSGLHNALHTPRLDAPRRRIPAGSVGLAGEHTGVYPQATPGGWNLIGRTPLAMFDPQRDPPALLGVGDRVRFERIDASEFAHRSKGGAS